MVFGSVGAAPHEPTPQVSVRSYFPETWLWDSTPAKLFGNGIRSGCYGTADIVYKNIIR